MIYLKILHRDVEIFQLLECLQGRYPHKDKDCDSTAEQNTAGISNIQWTKTGCIEVVVIDLVFFFVQVIVSESITAAAE